MPQAFWDAAQEANLWTWANVFVLVTGANIHLRAAATGHPAWLPTGVVLAGLSLDDLASLHERMEGVGAAMGGGEGAFHFAWVVPGLLVAALLLLLVGRQARRVPKRSAAALLGGAGLFFGGAVGFEMVSGAYLDGGGANVVYALLYHVEEALEAAGGVLMAVAPLIDTAPSSRQPRRA